MYEKDIKKTLLDHEERIKKLEEFHTIKFEPFSTTNTIQKQIHSEKTYSEKELKGMKMQTLRELAAKYNLKETSKEILIGKFLNKQSDEILRKEMEME